MRMIGLIIILFFGCGGDLDKIKITKGGIIFPSYYDNFDPDLHIAIYEYEAHSKDQGKKFNARELDDASIVQNVVVYDQNGSIMPNVIGACRKSSSGRRVIEVKAGFFYGQLAISGKALVFHELAHCLQDRPHNNSVTNGCRSIMSSVIPSSSSLSSCWNYMIYELFNPGASLVDSHYIKQPNGDLVCIVRNK